jgi:tRNA-Thr(GGU) m(6)t(6)A37 methyltransferase TsaA
VVEVEPEFAEGLADVEGFSHLILVAHLHLAPGWAPRVMPFLDDRPRGVFATRSPRRPNPLGLSLVRLERVEGARLHILDIDLLDGTPLLDIKPYVPLFTTARPTASAGSRAASTASATSGRTTASPAPRERGVTAGSARPAALTAPLTPMPAASGHDLGAQDAPKPETSHRWRIPGKPEPGFEPGTCRLQGGCSDQLSYSGGVPARVAAPPASPVPVPARWRA